MDTEDNYAAIYKKVEFLNEKCLHKDEIIKNLIKERDSIRDNYMNSSMLNKNEFFNFNQNTDNFKDVNRNYFQTQRPINSNSNSNSSIDKNNKIIPEIIIEGNKSILSKKNNINNETNYCQSQCATIENVSNDKNSRKSSIMNNNNTEAYVSVTNNSQLSHNQNQQKLQRNKSNSLLGSIKNLFTSDKNKK